MRRPARSASPAQVVPSVCAIRNATHLRSFPKIVSWTQKGSGISATALFLLLQGNPIARLSPHLLALKSIGLATTNNEELAIFDQLLAISIWLLADLVDGFYRFAIYCCSK